MDRRKFLQGALATPAVAGVFGPAAHAQGWPTRNITMIVPFPPGGQADLAARPVAQALEKILGKSVVVDNRSGAGGMLGNAAAARAEPDGHTLLMALSSMTFLPEAERLYDRKPSYEMDQLVPIARVLADPGVLCVRSDVALEDARRSGGRRQEAARPDLLQLLRQLRRRPRAVRDVRAGRRHQASARAVSRRRAGADRLPRQAGRHHRAGARVRSRRMCRAAQRGCLANWGAKRSAEYPDVPTFIELGYKDVEYYIWAGLFTPKGTPAPVITRLRDAMREVMKDPAGHRRVRQGREPAGLHGPAGVSEIRRRRRPAAHPRDQKNRKAGRTEMKIGLFDHIEHGERPTAQLFDERLAFIQACRRGRASTACISPSITRRRSTWCRCRACSSARWRG